MLLIMCTLQNSKLEAKNQGLKKKGERTHFEKFRQGRGFSSTTATKKYLKYLLKHATKHVIYTHACSNML